MALTLLGVIIGVSSVIIVGSIGMSAKKTIIKELESFGRSSLRVWRAWGDKPPREGAERLESAINESDLEYIRKECSNIKRVAPLSGDLTAWCRYRDRYSHAQWIATTPDYCQINNDYLLSGRFFNKDDLETKQRVCVIGPDIAKKLFPLGIDPLDKEIFHIGDTVEDLGKFRIVGVLQSKETSLLSMIVGASEENNRIIIPISVFHRSKKTNDLIAEAISPEKVEEASIQIKNILRQRHKERFQYEHETMQQHIEMANQILGTVGWLAVIAASISLLVGGIGIMNIMVSSVVERTKEIGIRKSLGASNKDIFFQFLTESIVLSLIGCLNGCFLGIGATLVIEILNNQPKLVALEFISLSIFISIVVGILSGLYPALRASSLDPVDALRYE